MRCQILEGKNKKQKAVSKHFKMSKYVHRQINTASELHNYAVA